MAREWGLLHRCSAPAQRGRRLLRQGSRPGRPGRAPSPAPRGLRRRPPRQGRLRAGSAAPLASAPPAKVSPCPVPSPPPPPGTSPACKTLSGFSNVKDGDNFKPLKPDGVSSPSFSDCKAPRLATRCADSPHPPKKEGDRPLGEGAGSGREGKRQDPRPAAGPERGERPPAGSPRPRLASYLQNGEALSDTTLTFCQVYFTCYTQTIQTGKNRNISQWSMYWYKLFSSTDVTEQI